MSHKYIMHVFDNGECTIVEADSEAQEDMEGVEIREDLFLSPKYRISTKSNVPLINENITSAKYLELLVDAPVDGDYQVNWYLEWSLSTTSNDFECRIKLGANNIAEMVQEPKDSSGSGKITTVLGTQIDTKTNQRIPYSGETEVTLTKGPHTIGIYFNSDKKNKTATIYRAYVKCERVA